MPAAFYMQHKCSRKKMNPFIKWCYRIGLVCGAIALVSALVVIAMDAGKSPAALPHNFAEKTFSVSGNLFIWLGVVLLVSAIGRLRQSWHRLSTQTKAVSVLGLLVGTFFSAYLFYWLFRDDANQVGRGTTNVLGSR
jgi:NhaP-type Na+/H+ or K+/H+ antiporter